MSNSQSHRQSLRLSGYDYRSPGAYFITICTQNCALVLDRPEVRDMVMSWWARLATKFPLARTDAFIVMPNHVHGIIVIADAEGQPLGAAPTIGDMVRWFKTMGTNEYILGVKYQGWTSFNKRLWQRNYYEHVIRNEASLNRIRQYILDNPRRWAHDRDNPHGELDKEETEFWESMAS